MVYEEVSAQYCLLTNYSVLFAKFLSLYYVNMNEEVMLNLLLKRLENLLAVLVATLSLYCIWLCLSLRLSVCLSVCLFYLLCDNF